MVLKSELKGLYKRIKYYLIHWVGKVHWRRDRLPTPVFLGFPGGSDGKESTRNARDLGSIPGVGKIPWRREQLPTPVFLPEESPWTEGA